MVGHQSFFDATDDSKQPATCTLTGIINVVVCVIPDLLVAVLTLLERLHLAYIYNHYITDMFHLLCFPPSTHA